MSDNFIKYVKCPYFKSHDQKKIRCEGPIDESTMEITFKDCDQWIGYMRKYCKNVIRCRECHIHKALDAKWREHDE